MTSPTGVPPPDPLLPRQPQTSDVDERQQRDADEHLRHTLAQGAIQVGPVLEILCAHLGEVVRTSDAAATTFLDGLIHVHDTVAEMREAALRAQQADRHSIPGEAHNAGATVGELVSSCTKVTDLATSMMAGLQFQDSTRQVIEHVVAALDDLGERFTSVGQALAEPGRRHELAQLAELERSLDQLRNGYVMQTQRATHADVLGSEFVVDDTAIDLF